MALGTILGIGAIVATGLLGASATKKQADTSSAIEKTRARHHALVLRRQANYERLNAQYLQENRKRLALFDYQRRFDYGQQVQRALADYDSERSGSGISINSRTHRIQRAYNIQLGRLSHKRMALAASYQDADLVVQQQQHLRNAEEYESDADTAESTGIQLGNSIRQVGNLNTLAQIGKTFSNYYTFVGGLG